MRVSRYLALIVCFAMQGCTAQDPSTTKIYLPGQLPGLFLERVPGEVHSEIAFEVNYVRDAEGKLGKRSERIQKLEDLLSQFLVAANEQNCTSIHEMVEYPPVNESTLQPDDPDWFANYVMRVYRSASDPQLDLEFKLGCLGVIWFSVHYANEFAQGFRQQCLLYDVVDNELKVKPFHLPLQSLFAAGFDYSVRKERAPLEYSLHPFKEYEHNLKVDADVGFGCRDSGGITFSFNGRIIDDADERLHFINTTIEELYELELEDIPDGENWIRFRNRFGDEFLEGPGQWMVAPDLEDDPDTGETFAERFGRWKQAQIACVETSSHGILMELGARSLIAPCDREGNFLIDTDSFLKNMPASPCLVEYDEGELKILSLWTTGGVASILGLESAREQLRKALR